jgi:hypothetical protein
MRYWLIVTVALGIASAGVPQASELDGVWFLDVAKSGPELAKLAPASIEFVNKGLDVRVVQVWVGTGTARLSAADFRVEPFDSRQSPHRDCLGSEETPLGIDKPTRLRARPISRDLSGKDEEWVLSADGRTLVVRKTMGKADVETLYYKRSTPLFISK